MDEYEYLEKRYNELFKKRAKMQKEVDKLSAEIAKILKKIENLDLTKQ